MARIVSTLALLLVTSTVHAETQRRAPEVTFHNQRSLDGREWRQLPIVSFPDDLAAERFINADLELRNGGVSFVPVPALVDEEKLGMGDARTVCTTSYSSNDLLAFVCRGVSIGAHPYEKTQGLAYDLRLGMTKRLAGRDLFGDVGAAWLAMVVAQRARDALIARGVDPGEVEPRLEPFEVFADHLEVTFDRCSLGTCMNGGTVVNLSCKDLSPWIRSDSPWRCK